MEFFIRIPLSFSQRVLFCLYPVGPHPLTSFRSFRTQGQCTRICALKRNYGRSLLRGLTLEIIDAVHHFFVSSISANSPHRSRAVFPYLACAADVRRHNR